MGSLGGTEGQLLWLRNPGGLTGEGVGFSQGWEQNVLLVDGPDVTFEFVKLQGFDDGLTYDVMVTAELWPERIMLYYVEDAPGAWADPENIRSVVVDDTQGIPFECHAVDLNMDGTLEILASAFEGSSADSGNLYAYLMPEDWMTPNWERRTIASGFTANGWSPVANKMTPGKQRLFYPSK